MGTRRNFIIPEFLFIVFFIPLFKVIFSAEMNQEKIVGAESILGQIHLDLAKYHESGRFANRISCSFRWALISVIFISCI